MAGTKTCLYRFCFKSELLFIKLAVSGFKSSAVNRKLCNLDCEDFIKIHLELAFPEQFAIHGTKSQDYELYDL